MKKLYVIIFLILIFSTLITHAQPLRKVDIYPYFYDLKIELAEEYGSATNFVETDKYGNLVISSPEVNIGDTRKFWVSNISYIRDGYDEFWLDQYIINATCQGIGDYCYIFVENDQWMKNVNHQNVQDVINVFENETPANPEKGIYEVATQYFGPVPDEIDGDPRIYILIMDIKDGWQQPGDGYIAGYFNFIDELENQEHYGVRLPGYTQDLLIYSNEVEIFYLDCDPANLGQVDEIGNTIAHEFQHMIHWAQDPEEELWIDEGCANYSMFLCGYNEPAGHVEEFCNHPNTSLTEFENRLEDYGASTLWISYLSDHFGGSDLISSLVCNDKHGIKSINQTLTDFGYTNRFNEIFNNWAIANYADVAINNQEQYTHKKFNLFNYSKASDTDPRSGMNPIYADTASTITISPYATQYLRFSANSENHIPIQIAGDREYNLSAKLLIEDLDGVVSDIQNYDIDIGGNGAQTIYDVMDQTYYTLALTSQTNSEITIEHGTTQTTAGEVIVFPNPSPGDVTFEYTLSKQNSVQIDIYDLSGDIIRQITDETPMPDEQIKWDGKNANGEKVASGVYVYIFRSGNLIQSGKIGLVR